MIVGIGIDIVEVARIEEHVQRKAFLEKVFSKEEIDFCEAKGKNKGQHYAARFSAKEAFLKATGKGLLLEHELHLIGVVSDENGKPEIRLAGKLKALAKKNMWRIHVSLSHIQSTACAMVILEAVTKK